MSIKSLMYRIRGSDNDVISAILETLSTSFFYTYLLTLHDMDYDNLQ